MRDEPGPKDLFEVITDVVVSNTFVRTLYEKLSPRSYGEFSNRVIGIGLLLILVGLLAIIVSELVFGEESLAVFGYDFTQIASLMLMFVALWLASDLIYNINVGIGFEERVGEYLGSKIGKYIPRDYQLKYEITEQLIAIGMSLFLFYLIFEVLTLPGSNLENLRLILVLGFIVGLWLIAVGYLLRGLSSLVRIAIDEYRWRDHSRDD